MVEGEGFQPAGTGSTRHTNKVSHALHAHPWIAAATAAVVVAAGVAIGVGASRGNRSASSPANVTVAATPAAATACPDGATLLGVLRPALPPGASATSIGSISCWRTWVVALPVGNGTGNSWAVFSIPPKLHVVTSSTEKAAFDAQVCGTTSSPTQWRTSPDIADCAAAVTTTTSGATGNTGASASSLNGTYTISLPSGDEACGSPSLSDETLIINGTSATITTVGGRTTLTGTATINGSTFVVHVTNGISDAPGAIVVDLNGRLASGGGLSGQSQNSGIYPGGQQGFGCTYPFTARRSVASASPTTTAPTSTTAGNSGSTGSSGQRAAPCTLAALTAGAQAAGERGFSGVDPHGYGCSGNWADAGVALGNQEEVTWIFQSIGGAWQHAQVQLDCSNETSTPALPPSILQAACNSN